jgi:hypothetical protein
MTSMTPAVGLPSSGRHRAQPHLWLPRRLTPVVGLPSFGHHLA